MGVRDFFASFKTPTTQSLHFLFDFYWKNFGPSASNKDIHYEKHTHKMNISSKMTKVKNEFENAALILLHSFYFVSKLRKSSFFIKEHSFCTKKNHFLKYFATFGGEFICLIRIFSLNPCVKGLRALDPYHVRQICRVINSLFYVPCQIFADGYQYSAIWSQ